MNRMTFILVAVAATLMLPLSAVNAQETTSLTIMSYNIHHGEGTDGKVDLERIADVILSVEPDLVALQEVDKYTNRTNNIDQTRTLAQLTGMYSAFGRAMTYDDGEYGGAILSKFPIKEQITRILPYSPGHEPRALIEVQVEVAGTIIAFFGTHLDHVSDSPDRLSAIKEIGNIVDGYEEEHPGRPMILAGDLNAPPMSEEINLLRKKWYLAGDGQDLHTFPSEGANRQIDYIAFRPFKPWNVKKVYTLEEPVASDHRPIVAEIELAQE